MEKLQPTLRFSEFDGNWKNTSLEIIGEYIGGGTPKTSIQEYWEGEIPWISSSDIIENDIHNINVQKYITEDAVINSATKKIPAKSLIIVSRVGVGKFAINSTEVCTSQDFTNIVIDKDSYNPNFAAFNLYKNIEVLFNISQGTSIKGFTITELKKTKLTFPSLPEQTKIASFLSAVDEKLNFLKEKKAALEVYKKGMMQKIFSQEIRFKDENGSKFPEWKVKNLGELSKLKGGYAFKSSEFRTSGIPVIRISNISNKTNFIDLNNVVYYAPIMNDHNFTLNKGDLLIAMSGATTGKSCVFNLDEKGYVNQRVGLFVNNDSKILHYPYLIQFVFSKEFFRQLDGVLVAGAQPNVSSSDIESFFIPCPSFEEQIKIASFLSAIDEKIILVSKQIAETQEYKKGLLQQMFC